MKKIGMALLILVIIVFNFIIGANEKGLRIEPITVLMSLIFIYLIIIKIKDSNKSIFFKSKIDYLVLIFMLTTTLPFIFGTYCSYSDNVEFILKYFFIYSVYILARNVITEKKQINHLITATLICSLIPIILEIDFLNSKYLEWIVKDLNLTYETSKNAPTFAATFGYSNAVSIYLSLCLFLALYKIKNSENKIEKVITIIYVIFSSYIIWITKSRSIIAVLVLMLAVYLIINNKDKIIKNWKKLTIISSALVIVGTVFIAYAINIPETVVPTKRIYNERLKYNFKPNTTYTVELEIQADVNANEIKNTAFELRIIQGNKYFQESKIGKKIFGEIDGKVSVEFTPEEGYSYINLQLVNDFYRTVNIKKCYINGEEYILKFKYLPEEIGHLFSDYFSNGKSLKEREYIYKDCLKIAQENWIIGQGGNTWLNLSPAVEEYRALFKETHSYFFELLISYGIIGVIAFLTLVISLFIKIFKQMKNDKEKVKEKLLIFIGLFFVLIHSITFDFNMSFMLIQLMVYIYMAVLIYDEQENVKVYKIVDYVVLILLALILSTCIRASIAKCLVEDYTTKHSIASYSKTYGYEKLKQQIVNEEDNKKNLNDIKAFIIKEPYYNQTDMSKMYFGQICNNPEKLSDEEIESYLEFEINQLKTVKFRTPLFIESILGRANVIQITIDKLKEYEEKLEENENRKEIIRKAIQELENIIEKEYEINIQNLSDKEKTGYNKTELEMVKNTYLGIINKKVD